MAIYFGQNKFFEYYIRVNDIVGKNNEKHNNMIPKVDK